MRRYFFCVNAILLLLVLTVSSCTYEDYEIKQGRGIVCSNGMVVSAHPEASGIGTGILIEGGNAFDAAAATAFALAVSYPTAGNIGGGGLMVIRDSDGRYATLDCREKAPDSAMNDMYLDEEDNIIKGMSTSTLAASGVPGSVAGILEMHSEYGSLPLKKIIQPSIDLAREGFPVTSRQAKSLNSVRKRFINRNDHPVPFVKDNLWAEGDTLIQADLARTLERIRDNGTEGFYSGSTADMIVKEMKKGNGLINHNDLENYSAVWREPVTGMYSGYKIISIPPPSSGGVAVMQLLGIMEDMLNEQPVFHSSEDVHLMIEAERRIYADRSFYLGDPDFVEIPVNELVNKDYLIDRMSDFDTLKTSSSANISHGLIVAPESEETTHFSVIDKDHNAIAFTTTLNSSYGNCIVVEGAGFLLNNEMDDFSSKPGYPNIYGLIGGEANSVQPGKRMLSSMTPAIVEKDNNLYMVLGSPGGSTIITSVFQTLLNVLEYQMNMQQAVDAPRFHHQWMPDLVYFEKLEADSVLIRKLENMGHNIQWRSSIGRVDAIRIIKGGKMEAGADSRGDDMACGY
ncbi:MAG TPA: gamma-glutamyltransferase [Bacteroidales bacterium]|nr:gamma-glutamyltransferase [Bacteroidales bacterium]